MEQLTEQETQKRIELAKVHLADISNSQTFRKEIEATEKLAEKEGIEAYWRLQDKLSRELANHLIRYKGSSEATAFCLRLADILNGVETPEEKWYLIRTNIKGFLESDEDIPQSEPLKKIVDEAIAEDTMDSYYNLLKGFRKSYDELVKYKTEEGADTFLEKLTNIVHDRNKDKE